MNHPHPHGRRHMHGEPREMLSATLLGLGLMMMLTIWWWYVMR